jgi:methyltransferase-like protein/trans-aconitate methyltransferase
MDNFPLQQFAEEGSYDAIPYDSYPHFESQPAHIAATASLLSLNPPDIATSKVLELGCASGGNLIPLAFYYPNASFLGIDISGVQIKNGLAKIEALGLTNIELRKASITSIERSDGIFDYIICHGVYSWVPVVVRKSIWKIFRDNLKENGIAYLSYNVLPGWHLKAISRDVMKYHASKNEKMQLGIQESRGLIDDLSSYVSGVYGSAIQLEKEAISANDDYYISHEYLEGENAAFYVKDIIAEAVEHSLSYISSSDVIIDIPELSPLYARKIREFSGKDSVATQQYYDFFIGRQFRASIFSKKQQAVNMKNFVEISRLYGLHFMLKSPLQEISTNSDCIPASCPIGYRLYFTAIGYISVYSQDKIVVIDILNRMAQSHPSTISFAELMNTTNRKLDESVIVELFIELMQKGMLQYFSHPIKCSGITERPRVFPIIILDVTNGESTTTNVLHTVVNISGSEIREFIPLLDGSRSHSMLIDESIRLSHEGKICLSLGSTDQHLDENEIRNRAEGFVMKRLKAYARAGLLL